MELPVNTLTLILAVFLTVIITLIAYILLRNLKESHYNREMQRSELESLRKSLEVKMYDLNDRLTYNENRWRDVNHLVIDSNKNYSNNDFNKEIYFSNFLKSNGIAESELKIDKDLIFVLTPFNERYLEDYFHIKNICSEVGFKCTRGDEEYFSSDIFAHILKQLVKARIVIVNLNGRNPNVLYELGLAQAMDKSVILISKTPNDIPIDIRSKKFIIYQNSEGLENQLKKELIRILNTTPNIG